MTTYEVLVKAREAISLKENWVQNELVEFTDQGPRFCALGAIGLALGFDPVTIYNNRYSIFYAVPNIEDIEEMFSLLANEISSSSLSHYSKSGVLAFIYSANDMNSHDEILSIFDRAIEIAAQNEGINTSINEEITNILITEEVINYEIIVS